MRNQIPAQAERKKSVYIGKKITSIYGESTNQDSKPKQINTNGMVRLSLYSLITVLIK